MQKKRRLSIVFLFTYVDEKLYAWQILCAIDYNLVACRGKFPFK